MPQQLPVENAVYKSGPFVIDTRTGELTRDGVPLKLRPQAFRVLCRLIERQGELTTREELISDLWGDQTHVEFDQGLNFCIREIRRHLNDNADEPKYIQTLPRRGYRFVAPVEKVERHVRSSTQQAVDIERIPATHAPVEASAVKPSMERLRWSATRNRILAAVLLAVGVVVAFLLVGRAVRKPDHVRMVVLPFDNLTGNDHQDYLVRGLTEELTARLSNYEPSLISVVGRTSADAVAKKGWTIGQISSELGTDYVLEGSVRQQGETLRITAQMIRAGDMAHVWAASYDRPAMELFTVEAEVASTVAREIGYALGRQIKSASALETSNAEAMDAFLRGKQFADQFITVHEGSLSRDPAEMSLLDQNATRELERAADLDRHFALPLVTLARMNSISYGPPDQQRRVTKSNEYARQALSRDPTLASAYVVLARNSILLEPNATQGKQYLDRALELSPNNYEGLTLLSRYYLALGQPELGLETALRAKQVEPMVNKSYFFVALAYHYAGRDQEALKELDTVLAKSPDYFRVVLPNEMLIYAHLGDKPRFVDAYVSYLDWRGNEGMPEAKAEAVRLRTLRDQRGPGAAWEDLHSEAARTKLFEVFNWPGANAVYFLAFHEPDKALAELEKEGRVASLMSLMNLRDPSLSALKGNPRYEQLITHVTAAVDQQH